MIISLGIFCELFIAFALILIIGLYRPAEFDLPGLYGTGMGVFFIYSILALVTYLRRELDTGRVRIRYET